MYPSTSRFGGKHHHGRKGKRNPPNNPSSRPQQSNVGGPSQSHGTRVPQSQENSARSNPAPRRSGHHRSSHGVNPSLPRGSTTGKGRAPVKATPAKASQDNHARKGGAPPAGNSSSSKGKPGKPASTKDANAPIQKPTVPSDLHSPTTPSSPSAFQRLPAEIRLKIYAYVFQTYRVEILRKKNTKEGTKKPRYRLYHKRLRPQRTSKAPIPRWTPLLPIPLVYTCRSIYSDTILLLYAHTQFVFTSTKAIARFVKVTPPDAQAAIRHVELTQVMYNEPHLTKFRIHKARSDMAFYLACEDMALAFKGLRVLRIDLRIYDWPIRLQIGERWSLPLLFFGRENASKLDDVKIRLRMVMFSEENLRRVARQLEERMMDPVKFQIREDERLARELQPDGPKARVLRLIM